MRGFERDEKPGAAPGLEDTATGKAEARDGLPERVDQVFRRVVGVLSRTGEAGQFGRGHQPLQGRADVLLLHGGTRRHGGRPIVRGRCC